MIKRSYYSIVLFATVGLLASVISTHTYGSISEIVYVHESYALDAHYYQVMQTQTIKEILLRKESQGHIITPDSVRAIYMSSWVAGTTSLRNKLIEFVENSDVNAVIIDIKDSTGVISFDMDHPLIDELETDSSRIRNIEGLIEELHAKNIYVIGRLTAFQDPLLSGKKPEWSFKRVDNGALWEDRKGLSFINPRYEGPWNYLATIAEESYKVGFDEINIDYIRFPSDGEISNIDYQLSEGETRPDVMKRFYEYMDTRIRGKGIPMSADIFGLVTTTKGDIGIGQIFEDIYPHFDAIAPMVYPSHYSTGFFGFENPNANPYQVVTQSMTAGMERAIAIGEDPQKLRTWIQDFSLGSPSYGVTEVRAQIDATFDIGLDSYMSWDPKNKYTKNAYE
ncbi:MAG: hypothetical protein ACJAV6_000438 [Candidatus Paceibacteria bacterium]|jgi:hypothetical protein